MCLHFTYDHATQPQIYERLHLITLYNYRLCNFITVFGKGQHGRKYITVFTSLEVRCMTYGISNRLHE